MCLVDIFNEKLKCGGLKKAEIHQLRGLLHSSLAYATQPLIFYFFLGLGVECLEELKHLEVDSYNFNPGEELRVKKLQSIVSSQSDDLDPTTSKKYSTQTGNLLLVNDCYRN